MKNNNIIKLFTACAVIYLSSCGGGGDGTPDPILTPTTYSSGEISEDVTWTSDNVYVLDGRVVVPNGVTLTIEAGTKVHGHANATLYIYKSSLVVNGAVNSPVVKFVTPGPDVTITTPGLPVIRPYAAAINAAFCS